jgi:hypothetical protein
MAASEFWPKGARLAITISLMFESGGEVRPDSGALPGEGQLVHGRAGRGP